MTETQPKMEISCRDIDILELLPQRPPFIMVDSLTIYSDKYVETEFRIKEDNMMCEDGIFSACGLIENIAQTSAARIGYYYKYILKKPVQIGYVGAIRSLSIYRNPAVNEQIRTRIEVEAEAFGMTSFSAFVYDAEGNILAEGQMKTAI